MTSIRTMFALLLVVALLALPKIAAAQGNAVTGTVTYRERVGLPADAQITIELVEIARASTPAAVVARQQIQANGRQVPFQFSLAYDPAQVNQNSTYAVQANIRVNGQPRFINLAPTLVITQGRPTNVNLVLNAAGGNLPNTAAGDTLLLAVVALLLTLMGIRMLRVRMAGGAEVM